MRCQWGHDIPPGYTYCAEGHPIALEAMQLAGGEGFGGQYQPPAHHPQTPPPQQQYAQGPPGYDPTGAMTPFSHSQPEPSPPPAPAAHPMPAPIPDAAPQAAPSSGRKLMGFLVSFHGDPLGAFYPVYAGVNLIGRRDAADGLHVAIADPATSSNHANLHLDPATSRAVLEDLGSTNGSFVNDERLPHAGHRDLQTGDRIRFGSYTATLLMVPQG